MSNQQDTKSTSQPTTAPQASEQLRGQTPHIQQIDDAGFAPQGSVKNEQEDGVEKLSTTDFGTEPNTVVGEPTVEVVDTPTDTETKESIVHATVGSETQPATDINASDIGFDGQVVDHDQVAQQVESVIKDVQGDWENEELKNEETAVDIIAGSAEQLIEADDICDKAVACSGRLGYGYGQSATEPLVGFAIRLATLGILVKNIDGEVDGLNATQTKGYQDLTQVSQMLWTAKIPSGGFGGMTGAQYIRSLKNILESVANNHTFVANFLIAPDDKNLDTIEDIGADYEDGKLISLADAIDQRLKISKHQILILITGKGSNSNALLNLQSTCDQNVEGFYLLTNTVEVITPSLLAMTRYIAKLASTGKFAISVDEHAGFYTHTRMHELPLELADEADEELRLGSESILEVFENYSINIIETEHKLSETINPITTPSRLLDMLNTVAEDVGIERYSKVAVTTQKEHDVFYSQLGATVHRVSFLLAQSWNIELPDEDEMDDDEDESEDEYI